jgi:hypothetical protein
MHFANMLTDLSRYLTESSGVSNYASWDCVMNKHRHLNLLQLHFLIKEMKHAVHLFPDIESNRLQLHSTCLNLGQV